jgi:hypothetical protein
VFYELYNEPHVSDD